MKDQDTTVAATEENPDTVTDSYTKDQARKRAVLRGIDSTYTRFSGANGSSSVLG